MVEKFLEEISGTIYEAVWNTWYLNNFELVLIFGKELIPRPMGRNTMSMSFSMLTTAW